MINNFLERATTKVGRTILYNPVIRKALIRFSPRTFIKFRYRLNLKHYPDLDNPKTLSEKLVCRMLYDHDDLYTICADKVAVREYVKTKIEDAETYYPQWYGVYENPDDIEFEELPNAFVLKSNHASGQVLICPNKKELDIDQTTALLKKWLKTNWYYEWGEWQYKNIKPQIICEELLENNIKDYRIFCFEGEPMFIRATIHDETAKTGYGVGVYDTKWDKFPLWQDTDNIISVEKPKHLDTMVELSKRLSEDFHFVRVDLYEVNGKVYFSELTFTPNGGIYYFKPDYWDEKLGQAIVGDLKTRM